MFSAALHFFFFVFVSFLFTYLIRTISSLFIFFVSLLLFHERSMPHTRSSLIFLFTSFLSTRARIRFYCISVVMLFSSLMSSLCIVYTDSTTFWPELNLFNLWLFNCILSNRCNLYFLFFSLFGYIFSVYDKKAPFYFIL